MILSTEPSYPDISAPRPEDSEIFISRGEVEALCMKAARGAGMEWGLAEEAGFSVGWLWAHGVDGTQVLLDHLLTLQTLSGQNRSLMIMKGSWQGQEEAKLCPIFLGAALSDYLGLPEGLVMSGRLMVGPVSQPLLLLPFLASIAKRLNRSVHLAGQGAYVTTTPSGGMVYFAIEQISEQNMFEISLIDSEFYDIFAVKKMAVKNTILSRLNDFALKTTVAVSDQSRADAGAGIEENDE